MPQTTQHIEELTILPAGDRPDRSLPNEGELTVETLLPRCRNVGITGAGGTSKAIASWLHALAVKNGVYIPMKLFDSDYRTPDPRRLPDGRLISLPSHAVYRIGEGYSRDAIKDEPLLLKRYREVLATIPVFESYGRGGGGDPVISAIDFDRFIRQVRRQIHLFLQTVTGSRVPQEKGAAKTWYELFAEQRRTEAAPQQGNLIILIGGGCGSVGPAGHLLLPYIIRQEAANLGMKDLYLVSVLTGPRIYSGLHSRVATNWLATVEQLEYLNHHGLRWEFIDKSNIDSDKPPADRCVLFDAEPEGEKVTTEELDGFAAEVAKSLWVALTSDVFQEAEARAVNDSGTPWTTLRTALAYVDTDEAEALTIAERTASRLATLAGAGSS